MPGKKKGKKGGGGKKKSKKVGKKSSKSSSKSTISRNEELKTTDSRPPLLRPGEKVNILIILDLLNVKDFNVKLFVLAKKT